jgi:hypothetical protein
VVGPIGTVAQALDALDSEEVHGALLDASLPGEPVTGVADALSAKSIPFAFVTGHSREQLPPAYRDVPLVKKPFTGEDLLTAVAGFAAPSAT